MAKRQLTTEEARALHKAAGFLLDDHSFDQVSRYLNRDTWEKAVTASNKIARHLAIVDKIRDLEKNPPPGQKALAIALGENSE